MDEIIEELARITYAFVDKMNNMEYEEVEIFVNQRENLIQHIRSREQELLNSHKTIINNLLQYDNAILDKMLMFKDEAGSKLKQLSNANVQKNAYDMSHSNDSMYFDRKK